MTIQTAPNGCRYLDHDFFVVVVTPHAIERKNERAFIGYEMLPWYTIHAMLAYGNRNQFVRWGGFQIYCNKKFNACRNREEVEVISFTPDNWTRSSDVCVLTIA